MEISAYGKALLTLTQLLHQLLIFVELLQSFYIHVRDVDCFGLITVLLIPQQTHREFGPWRRLQPGEGRSESVPGQQHPRVHGASTETPYRSTGNPAQPLTCRPQQAGGASPGAAAPPLIF